MVSWRIPLKLLALLVLMVILASLRSGGGALAHPVEFVQLQTSPPPPSDQDIPTPVPQNPAPKSAPDTPQTSGPIVDYVMDQTAPAIAFNPASGTYLVAYQDWLATYTKIVVRQVQADGTPSAPVYLVSGEQLNAMAPDLAYNSSNGEYLVVWEQEYNATDHDIYARRIAADGNPAVGIITVSYANEFESTPVVAYNETLNEYMVAWVYRADMGGGTYQERVAEQRLSAAGALIESRDVIGYSSGNAKSPDLSYSPTSQYYLLVWSGQDAGGDYDVVGQRVLYNGVTVGDQILLAMWENNQLRPRLAYNPERDEFLAVWTDYHWDLINSLIYGQRLQPNGTMIGGAVVPPGQSANGNQNPDVTFQPSAHGYLLTWEYMYSYSDHDVYKALYSGTGSVLQNATAVSTFSTDEKKPVVASDAGSGVEIIWEDSHNYAVNGIDLYGSQIPIQLPTFSGNVYLGQSGDLSTPLSGVTIGLYCSNTSNVAGTLVTAMETDAQGGFNLPCWTSCEYYNLIETIADDYFGVFSNSPGGQKISVSWLQYAGSLQGRYLGGNQFWLMPQTPEDTTPPGNWSAFLPATWVTSQQPLASVHVEDTQSGLDVTSALFSFSTNNGSTWSSWQAAACTDENEPTAPEIVSAIVPFGTDSGSPNGNWVKFQISDRSGNPGESSAYPVLINSIPPQNPGILDSADHTVGVWSNNLNIRFDWSSGLDSSSGIYGYAIAWNQSPNTVPDASRDTADTTYTTYAMVDGNNYYFHVRSLDVAGNGAVGAIHTGPYFFDTGAPSATYYLPTGSVNSTTFNVSWYGYDSLSGIANYDVQTSPDNSSWSDWQMATTSTFAWFTGARGGNYYFRLRTRDNAGNLSYWSYSGPVHIGVDVTVRTRDEYSNNLVSRVYLNNNYVGMTGGAGTLVLHDVIIGDQLAADHKKYERWSNKGHHQNYGNGGDWAWQEYLTSIHVENSGTTTQFNVVSTSTTQDLVLRKNQGLVLVHMLVSVEWDAETAYMDALRTGLQNASAYLYDVTDGQFVWGKIEVFDNAQYWGDADVRIYANQRLHANCNGAIGMYRGLGGLTAGTDMQIHMPGYYLGSMYDWQDAYRTFMHEFGHYGLWLADEYLDRDGNENTGAHCTTNFINNPNPNQEAVQASIMHHQWFATELCSKIDPNHMHDTNTFQDEYNDGEDTWQTVIRHYSGGNLTIQSADTRGVIMPGPNTLPIPSWVQVNVTDYNTGACPPFMVGYVYSSNNQPVKDMNVWVVRPGSLFSPLYQGVTDGLGEIQVLGAHNGDGVLASKKDYQTALASTSASAVVNCSTAAPASSAQAEQVASPSGPPIGVTPDPFTMAVQILPLNAATVELRVTPTVSLPAAPLAKIWQDGLSNSIGVPLVYDPALQLYKGQAVLNVALGRAGNVEATATDSAAHTVTVFQPFNIEQAIAGVFSPYLRSDDAHFELMLPPGRLNTDSDVTIQPVTVGPNQQDALWQVGWSYQVILSSGQSQLNGQATINLSYPPEFATGVDPRSIQLYRWDNASRRWVYVGSGYVDLLRSSVSTKVDRLGVFALFGAHSYSQNLFLPLISR